ncbi:phage Gp37/Gp68 family protein [Bradyrhizobium sp. PMVTL-01]|uniref:phage Gp37/Gp68 family protein n=1 Tax=Bradyrhizobium sp. PMVTL-01 TaxID=3434999 RepID=UPI003F70C73A
MSKTSIEWTQATWNPIVGCSIVSPGCTNCYAMTMAARIEAMNREARESSTRKPTAPQYDGTTQRVNGNAVWTGVLKRASEKTLLEPLRNRKPTLYFVNSMSDLFHEAVPDEWIDQVFAIMALTPQHTFQVLTKRATRMRKYLSHYEATARIALIADQLWSQHLAPGSRGYGQAIKRSDELGFKDVDFELALWPLPNVWLGVSTERQKEADERIPELLATPAAVRFISAEPLLGPIDLSFIEAATPEARAMGIKLDALALPKGLNWVIVGGESGPGSRPMHPDWARSLRDQCLAAGVPFLFKQWGSWRPEIDRDRDDPDWRQPYSDYKEPTFQILNLAGGRGFHGERVHVMRACSKKSAGRKLDGMLHDEMPAAFEGRRSLEDQLEGVAP